MREMELRKELARLESKCDYLVTELEYIDEILKTAGFRYGIDTLKAATEELIRVRGNKNGKSKANN